MRREAFGSSHTKFNFLSSQGMELTKSLFAGLLIEQAIAVRTVKLFLFLLQMVPILEHVRDLLAVEQAIGLAGSEGRGASKSKRVRSVHIQPV